MKCNAATGSVQVAFALLAFGCCLPAQAGAPFLTDDPEPVEFHRTEINLALQDTRSDAGRSGALAADVNWGCAREVQCHVALPIAYSNAQGVGMQSGIGDVEVGVKYRIYKAADTGFMMAIYPTAYLATGAASRGLGNGHMQILLPVWVQKSAGPWAVNVGTGYLVNHAAGARNSWFSGLVAQRSFGEGLKLGVEVFHRTSVAQDTPPPTGFDVGAVVKLSANRNLLASVGKGLQGVSANRRSLYLAYQLEL